MLYVEVTYVRDISKGVYSMTMMHKSVPCHPSAACCTDYWKRSPKRVIIIQIRWLEKNKKPSHFWHWIFQRMKSAIHWANDALCNKCYGDIWWSKSHHVVVITCYPVFNVSTGVSIQNNILLGTKMLQRSQSFAAVAVELSSSRFGHSCFVKNRRL